MENLGFFPNSFSAKFELKLCIGLTGSARWGRRGKRRAAPGGECAKPLAAWAARRGEKRCAAPGERPPKLLAAWPEHGERSPYTATSACSALPSPQQDWTELANRLHRKGPIDFEKCKLEKGAIWSWTEPTLTATASEKFLDIYVYFFC